MSAVVERVEVKVRPILFKGEMVKAILEGRKTQTRRVVKPQPDNIRTSPFVKSGLETVHGYEIKLAYGQPGDRLWVRETFSYITKAKNEFYDKVRPDGCPVEMLYRADYPNANMPMDWSPSIFMPRWASRITLEVTGVRVERLQSISDQDAIAEGAPVEDFYGELLVPEPMPQRPSQWYRDLWDKINAKKYPWASNPWVFVISFRRIENAS